MTSDDVPIESSSIIDDSAILDEISEIIMLSEIGEKTKNRILNII